MAAIWPDAGQRGPPPRPGQRSPGRGYINEQAALEGTGPSNADKWSLQSRDERREATRGEAAMKKGFHLHLGFL